MMENLPTLCTLSQQIGSTCEHLRKLAVGSAQSGSDALSGLLQDMLLDEVEHIQILVVELSKLVTACTGDAKEFYAVEKECDSNKENDT